ncbi:unnamed protein product, partial [Laminaria digitata]
HPLQNQTDTISDVLSYSPTSDYLFLATVNRGWKTAWESSKRPKTTSVHSAAATPARVERVLNLDTFHRAAAPSGGVFCLAAQAGNLKGLRVVARVWGRGWTSQVFVPRMTAIAARGGNLEILEWAWSEGCHLSPHLCTHAAEGGRLNVLQWARERGCNWNKDTCRLAAFGGHLGVLKWARDHGCPLNEEICRFAAEGGHLDVLRWAREEQ